ncbi:MAG TPA: response regulator [Blastocatellia bacterium]|nr:response regulator [Blastocatellia bacterium]
MPRVLLVDDEPDIRHTMAEVLNQGGYETVFASDYAGAISLIENSELDAAVVDIMLSGRSGIDILQHLRDREPYVPVIMMTGEPDISRLPEIVRAGVCDFLSKPANMESLIRTVSKAVEKKRLIDEKRRLELQVKRHVGELELAVAERTSELVEAHNFLNMVLDSSTGYSFVAVDDQGRITLFNRGAELMFGYSPNEALGRPARELLGGGKEPTWPLFKAAEQIEPADRNQAEFELRRRDDSSFIASVTTTPIRRHDGLLLGYLGIIKDLTEERQNEERFRQMQARLAHNEKISALGRMAAQVAHEVKNPLAGLRLYALHLKSKIAGKLPDAEEALVDKIVNVIDQLSDTAEQVLSFARLVTLTRRPADLNRIITDCIPLLAPQISAKSITVELNLAETEALASVDAAAMRSTLMNLILNSVQAMNRGGMLRVSTARSDDGVQLEIVDNGSGMTEEEVKNVFEPFYTTKSKGLGLGMSFAAKVIEQHGGSILVDSRLREGTRISIMLPAEAEGEKAYEAGS